MNESRRIVVELFKECKKGTAGSEDEQDVKVSNRYMEYTRASRILARIMGEADSFVVQKIRQDDEEEEQQLLKQHKQPSEEQSVTKNGCAVAVNATSSSKHSTSSKTSSSSHRPASTIWNNSLVTI